MALGVARGMQALEEAQPPILHRDLKPSNVFIDAGAPPLGCSLRIPHTELMPYTLAMQALHSQKDVPDLERLQREAQSESLSVSLQ